MGSGVMLGKISPQPHVDPDQTARGQHQPADVARRETQGRTLVLTQGRETPMPGVQPVRLEDDQALPRHTQHLAQSSLRILEMMQELPARYGIEGPLRKRQRVCRRSESISDGIRSDHRRSRRSVPPGGRTHWRIRSPRRRRVRSTRHPKLQCHASTRHVAARTARLPDARPCGSVTRRTRSNHTRSGRSSRLPRASRWACTPP